MGEALVKERVEQSTRSELREGGYLVHFVFQVVFPEQLPRQFDVQDIY